MALPVDFPALTQDDLKVVWYKIVYPEADENSGEPSEETIEEHTARISGFEKTDKSVTLTFDDAEGAAELNSSYVISMKNNEAGAVVIVDFKDHTLTSDVAEVSSSTGGFDVTLTVAEGEFSPDISVSDVTLGDSFRDMTVESVTPKGNALTLTLKGSPVLLPEISTVFTAGDIMLGSGAFVNGYADRHVYIDVQAPVAKLDLSGISESGNAVTFPIELLGMDADKITAGDVSFNGEGEVTDVNVKDGKVFVTVTADGNTSGLPGDLQVGEASIVVGMTHAAVETVFDYIGADGGDLIIDLNVYTLNVLFQKLSVRTALRWIWISPEAAWRKPRSSTADTPP